MKKVLLIIAVLVAILVILKLVFAAKEVPAPAWNTKKADCGDILVTINATGTVEPLSSIQVGSQISGKVKEVLVAADAEVRKGQVLAIIDPELLEAECKDRELALKQARSAIAMLAVEQENLDLRESRTQVALERQKIASEQAQASSALASLNFQRFRELLKINATTQSEVDIRALDKDNGQRDLRLKQLDLNELELELRQVAADRKSLRTRTEQAELAVGQAQQALNKALTNLGYTSILSPIDGVVLERVVDPGQTLAAQFQAPNLFKIVSDLKTVKLTAQIDEADIGKVRAGQKVSFEVDAFRGEKFEGALKSVRLKSENRANLVSYPVIIEAQNAVSQQYPVGKLRPGMTAYLSFEIDKRTAVTRIPAAAVRFTPPPETPLDNTEVLAAEAEARQQADQAKKKNELKGLPATVYIIAPDQKLKVLPIRVGESDSDYYELLSGNIKAGDEVVTEKRQQFPVSLKKAED